MADKCIGQNCGGLDPRSGRRLTIRTEPCGDASAGRYDPAKSVRNAGNVIIRPVLTPQVAFSAIDRLGMPPDTGIVPIFG